MEPARILRRSAASEEHGAALLDTAGNGKAATRALKPLKDPQDAQPQASQQAQASGASAEAAAQHLSAEEKLLQELTDTLWMTCSALLALGRPDEIAGLHAFAVKCGAMLIRSQR